MFSIVIHCVSEAASHYLITSKSNPLRGQHNSSLLLLIKIDWLYCDSVPALYECDHVTITVGHDDDKAKMAENSHWKDRKM